MLYYVVLCAIIKLMTEKRGIGMIEQLKGAIFDMDGTLIDSLMVWDVLWEKFGKKFNNGTLNVSKEDDKAVRTMTLKGAMDYIHERYLIGESGDELLNEANAMMIEFYSEEVMLKKGVLEFLEYLKNRGVKMCIASATAPELIEIAAKHCEIRDYFEFIISCTEVGKGKDQPDIYIKAAEKLGTSISESCVFEDSHIAVNTAYKLGMKTVGIFDKYNYGHEEMRKIATCYIADGETLERLIK